MHDRAARSTGAIRSTAAMAIETMILLNIDFRIPRVRPHVEEKRSVLPALTGVPAPARGYDDDYKDEMFRYS